MQPPVTPLAQHSTFDRETYDARSREDCPDLECDRFRSGCDTRVDQSIGGKKMKSVFKLSFILSVFVSAQTMAATNPVEFWGCKFNDGMGMGDLMEWTEEWGEVVDDLPDDGYNAWVMTPMFKSNMTDLDFLWVGAWPDFARMGSGLGDFFNSDTGSATFTKFVEISTCEIHDLYSSVQVRENTGE